MGSCLLMASRGVVYSHGSGLLHPLIIYICDATFRYFRGQHPVSIVTTVHHPCDVLELELRKDGFVCTPGQVSISLAMLI